MADLKWKEKCVDLYMIDCNALDINDPQVMEFIAFIDNVPLIGII